MKRTCPVRTFGLNWRAIAICAMVLLMFAALVAPAVVSAQNPFQQGQVVGEVLSGGRTPPPPDPNSIGTQTPEIEGRSSLVASVLTALLEGLISLLGPILTALISGVIWVSSYNDFVNALAVVNGWVVVRDIANMFFIIVLLIIAFGTILGQEDYHYKKLLPKFLLLAILINFSRTIVGVMIDFTQVVMLTFVNGYSAAAGGNFANIFHIVDLLQYKAANCRAGSLSDWSIFGAAALAFIMIVISIITVVVILTVLALRIIMLWLLIVLSPLAFLAGTFPQGQKYYAQWWEEFKNQAMVGPMLAFFLWLSLVTVGGGNAASQLTQNGKPIVTGATDIPFACSAVGSTEAMMSYIIGTMMLLIGVQMSQQMGGAVSGVAMRAKGAAGRALKYGGRALVAPAAFGAKLGLQRLERGVLDFSTKSGGGVFRRAVKYTTPTAWKGFFKRGEVLLEESRKVAMAESEEESNVLFTRGKRRLPIREAAEHGLVGQYAKDYSFLSKEAVMKKAVELETLGGAEGERARAAIISVAAHGGFLDDIARTPQFRQKLVELGQKKYGYTDGTFYNKQLLQDLLFDYTTGAGVGSGKGVQMAQENPDRWQFQLRNITALEEPGKQTKHWEYLGHARMNPTTGKYEVGNKEWLTDYAHEEFGKLGDRDRTGAAPHVFHALRQKLDKDGKPIDPDKEDSVDTYGTIGDAEETMAHEMAKSAAKEPTRVQRRVPAWSIGTEVYEKADANDKPQVQGGDKDKAVAMADYVEKYNNEVDSDYIFAMYGALTNQRMDQAIMKGAFNIVDDKGNLVRTIKYKGTLKPPKEEGDGGEATPKGGGAPKGGGPAGGGGAGRPGGGGGAPTQPPPTPPTPPVAPPAAPVAPAPAVPAPRVKARKGGRVRIAFKPESGQDGRTVVDVSGNKVIERVGGQRSEERKIEEISEEEIRRIFGSVSIEELRGKGASPEIISRVEQARAAAPAPAAARPAAAAPAAGAGPAPEIPAEAIVSALAKSMQEIARQFDSLNIDRDLQNLTHKQEQAVKDAIQKVLRAVEKSRKTLSADTRRQISDLREAMGHSQQKLWNFLRHKGINKYTFPEIMRQVQQGEGSEGGPGGGQNA